MVILTFSLASPLSFLPLQDTLEMCSKEIEFKCILFALCYFHAVVAERRKFGAQGWNRSYPFNNGDLTISINVLYNYLEANPKVRALQSNHTSGRGRGKALVCCTNACSCGSCAAGLWRTRIEHGLGAEHTLAQPLAGSLCCFFNTPLCPEHKACPKNRSARSRLGLPPRAASCPALPFSRALLTRAKPVAGCRSPDGDRGNWASTEHLHGHSSVSSSPLLLQVLGHRYLCGSNRARVAPQRRVQPPSPPARGFLEPQRQQEAHGEHLSPCRSPGMISGTSLVKSCTVGTSQTTGTAGCVGLT